MLYVVINFLVHVKAWTHVLLGGPQLDSESSTTNSYIPKQTRFPKQMNYGVTKTGQVTGGDLLQLRQRQLTKKGFIVINTTHLNSISWCHVIGWSGICVHKKFHKEPNKMTRTCTLKWKIALWHLWHELKNPQMPLPSDLQAQNTYFFILSI